jgi:hypothetical protein
MAEARMTRRRWRRRGRAGSRRAAGRRAARASAEAACAIEADAEGAGEEHGLDLVGEEVEEVALFRGQLLVAREHAVDAVEEVAELEHADGDEAASPGGQRDEQADGDDEDQQVEDGDLVGGDPRRREEADHARRDGPHDVDIEEQVVLLPRREVDGLGLAEHDGGHSTHGGGARGKFGHEGSLAVEGLATGYCAR